MSLKNTDFTNTHCKGCTVNGKPLTPEVLAALGAVGTQTMQVGPTQAPVQAPSFTLPNLANAGVSDAMSASMANLGNIPSQTGLPNEKAAAAALNLDSPTNGMA